MGDDAIGSAPRKEGCLKSALGCLALVVIVGVFGLVAIGYFLSRWEPEKKAWDRLPRDAVWAVQAHDMKTLLQNAACDPGTAAFLSRVAESVAAGRQEAGKGGDTPAEIRFLAAYRHFGSLHTVFAPNSFLVGGVGSRREEAFLIFQTPTWLRWLSCVPGWGEGEGAIHERREEGETPAYFASRDGWMIVSPSRERVQSVLDGWDAHAAPLGAGPEENGAHLFLAAVDKPAVDEPRKKGGGDSPPPSHFTFADPFASVVAVEEEAVRESGAAVRVLIRPSENGWRVWGGANAEGSLDAQLLAREADAAVGDAFPVNATPASYDLSLSVRLSGEARDGLLAFFKPSGTDSPGMGSFSVQAALAKSWLYDSWFRNSGDVWSFLAAGPVNADPESPYPPLPRFGLGWTIARGVDPVDASDAFTNSLARLLDSARAPGGHLALQNLRASVSYFLDASPDAPGGVVGLPPVLVNAARPAWRFFVRGEPPAAWAATDPEAFPVGSGETFMPALKEPRPASGHVAVVGGWNLGNDFVDALIDFAEDRLQNHFAARSAVDETGLRAEKALRIFRDAAAGFPRGAVRADLDTANRRVLFKAAIAYGAGGK